MSVTIGVYCIHVGDPFQSSGGQVVCNDADVYTQLSYKEVRRSNLKEHENL